MNRDTLLKVSDIASWSSIIVFIVGGTILGYFIGFAETILYIYSLTGILILINISTLIQSKSLKTKIKEPLPLMKHRMGKFIALSLFLFGIGISIFVDSWNNGFRDSIVELFISVIIILFGDFFYLEYQKRDQIMEKILGGMKK